MSNRKIALLIVLVLTITMFASACGQSAPATSAASSAAPAASSAASSDAAPAEAKPATINFGWWGGEARHEKFNQILDMYEEKNPHITVERQYAPWGDYWTKLTTQLASNSMPDTFGMTSQYKGEFNAKDAMHPLDEYVASGKIDTSNFTAGAIAGGTMDGQYKFVTFGDTVSVLAYDVTVIKETGMDMPKGDMSYSELIAYATELSGKLPDDVYGIIYNWEHQFENHVRQHGMEIVADDLKNPGYTKEVLKEYFEYEKALFDAGAGAPAQVAADNVGKQWVDSLEGTGKMAMYQTNLNQLKIYQAQTERELGAVRGLICDDATHKHVEQVQPSGWAISPHSEVKDECADLISWFVNDQEVQTIFNMELGVPGSKIIQQMLVDNMGDTLVDNAKKIEIGLIQEILADVEPHPGRKEGAVGLWQDVDQKWLEIMFGRMTVDQAVDAHFDTAKTILG